MDLSAAPDGGASFELSAAPDGGALRLSTGAFAMLVAATIAAFFITQHLKVTTPLIQGSPRPVPGVIDPLRGVPCGKWNSGSTTISFYLQHRADTVDVYVINQGQTIVRTVAIGRHMRIGKRKPDGVFTWNGREDNGQVAPDGTYYFRVALIHQNRTIDLTGVPVRVKTVPPHPVVTSVSPALIPSSGGTSVTIHYKGNENRGGTVRIYRTDLPGAPKLVKSFLTPWNGHTAVWDGKIDGEPAPAGTYLVGLDVTDAACNTGHFPASVPPAPGTTPHAGVTISYLAAEPPLDPVPAGSDAIVGGALAGARLPVGAYAGGCAPSGRVGHLGSGDAVGARARRPRGAVQAGAPVARRRRDGADRRERCTASPGARGAAGAHLAGAQPRRRHRRRPPEHARERRPDPAGAARSPMGCRRGSPTRRACSPTSTPPTPRTT